MDHAARGHPSHPATAPYNPSASVAATEVSIRRRIASAPPAPAIRVRRFLTPRILLVAVIVAAAAVPMPARAVTTVDVDLVVYGGTPGGILAAVTAGRAGASVVLLERTRHVGGMMTSGLGWTDIGRASSLGGYTKEFFDQVEAIEGTAAGRYAFEPHVAEAAFTAMLESADVRVHVDERLPESGGVTRSRGRITSLTTTTGTRYRATVYVDASYEGDLMARAGVSFTIGREATDTYGESLAGVRPASIIVDDLDGASVPYLTAAPGMVGSSDSRIQASNYRLCFSSDPANQAPFSPPTGYRPRDYDVILRSIAERAASSGLTPRLSWVVSMQPLANDKWDVNDYASTVSSALPGVNWSYPTASTASRRDIEAVHRTFSEGLFYFLRSDRRVPSMIRTELAGLGLCRDEFTDNDHWPWQLYIREARRMVGAYVMTQADVTTDRQKTDIIGRGSYRIDSHLVSRWIDGSGRLRAEGVLAMPGQVYAIPYRAIIPKRGEIANLFVPVAASASHVAQSSLRMEPHYMLMGEAAGEAAAMIVGSRPSLGTQESSPSPTSVVGPIATLVPGGPTALRSRGQTVQDVNVTRLQQRLRAHGSVLTNPT